MLTLLLTAWLAGALAVAPDVYEDWRDKLVTTEDALLCLVLWPLMRAIDVYRIWRERG